MIVPGMNRLRSYDLENGEIVWQSAGLTMNPIPSPVAAEMEWFSLRADFRGTT